MADDQASQRRSRLAPPPTTAPPAGGATNAFRAAPAAARFGFGSSAPRSTAATTTTTTARASTLSTARTSTFSASAFGRTPFVARTPVATTTPQRPSSAETASSRLRQKPTTAAAAPPAASDLFASLASDQPPRSASGSSLPFAMSSSTLSFASSYSVSAVASKPAGQLFSMDDSDLGGDDGWGVDSPSNILSPASATDVTTGATSKPFEGEDEFGWADETPAATPPAPEPAPASVAPPTASVPELKFDEAASAPAVPSSSASGWGDEFAYSADATEAPVDEMAWNDDDEWGTSAPQRNGAAAPATTAVAEPPKSPVEPIVKASPVYIQAPPLSTASADLGAILSPTGETGELWGDEGDDLLFSDEEQPDAAPLETPLPDEGQADAAAPVDAPVATLSLETPPTVEEPKHEEPVPVQQPMADEFSYQETESNVVVTEAVAETSEWDDDEGDWGDQLRLSEVDAELPFSPPAQTETLKEPHHEEASHAENMAPETDVPVVPAEQTFEAEISHESEFSHSSTAVHNTVEATSSTAFFEEHAHSSQNEFQVAQATEPSTPSTAFEAEHVLSSHEAHHAVEDSTPSAAFTYEAPVEHSQNESHAVSDQHTEYYNYGDNSGCSYDNHVETVEVVNEQFEHQAGVEQHDVPAYVEEQAQVAYEHDSATAKLSTNEHSGLDERAHETFQRQVSWETHEEIDASVDKAAAVEDSQGQSFVPPSVSSGKAEVSFGTSSFAAAELTYGHYHHDHHRTPSEAEVGSVASFAEASSAGATFGGSDHVSDGTYSDGGDYASETRSVFGNSSAHSTAFITEPASSSDGQASNEDNGTYDHQSDVSSTVGGGGGAPSSEFDVSSTRSALFENEVASTGFDQGDEVYEYGEHSHHNHFEGSYENEYNHGISESSTEYTEQARSAFDHTDDSVYSNSGFGAPPDIQQSESPMYSRSSTPATYGVSSSQDLPTASDLEFDHTDTENLFASSSSQSDSAPFSEAPAIEKINETPQPTNVTPSAAPFDTSVATDDANPFASSGFGFPSPPAPPSLAAPPVESTSVVNSADEALPSADSLFGASPAKNSPFGSVQYDDTPVADAGSLFADAPAAPAFGGFEQPTPASASSFFGGGQEESHSYGYQSAPPQYDYGNASHTSAAEAFGGSSHSHGFETGAYEYESSYQPSSEAFGGQPQPNDYGGSYGYDTHSHNGAGAAEVFGAPGGDAFGGRSDTGFDGFGSASGDAVNADSFFGGGNSASTSAGDMFGSSGAHGEQHGFGYEERVGVEASQITSEVDQYPPSSEQLSFEHSVADSSAPVSEFASTPAHTHGEIMNNADVAAEAPDAFSSDPKQYLQHPEYHDEYHPQSEGEWSYGAGTETHSYESQQASHSVETHDASNSSEHQAEPPSAYHGYSDFGSNHDADNFFGRSASAPPNEVHSGTTPHSVEERFASYPPRSIGSPPQAGTAPLGHTSFDSVTSHHAELPKPATSAAHHGLNEDSASQDYSTVSSTHGHESGSQFESSPPSVDQSHHNDVDSEFSGAAPYGGGPFEQSAHTDQHADSSSFFGGQDQNGAFGEAPSFEQTADTDLQADTSAFFGGHSTNDAFGTTAPYDQNPDSAQQSDPSSYFGGESSSNAFGETTSYENRVDSAEQSDGSGFFGDQETSGAFGGSSSNGASGFFSSGPSQHHHAGGIYAQPPQHAAAPAYQGYDTASYGHHNGSHTAYDNQAGDYASGNEYSYHHHNQSASSGAYPQADGMDYGSSAPHDYKSPTAAGSSHFVSAQASSAFEYHNSTEASSRNAYPGGQHHTHTDASYRTPTLKPSSVPTTPTAGPSPLHVTKPQPNYNQFAAPAPVPGYYEAKASHGHGTAALTSNKHKDPNMVAPSCLSSFGFGGNVVTMFPKQKLRLNSASFAARSSPRTPQSMQYDNAPQGELRKGPVGLYRMEHVHPRNNEFIELDKFPGPLNESVSEETILQYVEEKMNSSAGATHQEEDERLLLGILKVLIKCNGRLRSDANSDPSEPSSPEVQLVSLLKESDQRRRRNHPSNFPPPKPVQYSTHSDAMLRNASRVRELLLLGDRKAAVDVAIQAQMWPEAMLIGSFTDKDEYKRVLCAYFTSHYAPGDPCRALYLSFADQQERSVHEPQKLMQHNKDENSSEILSSWVVHVQMLLANRTADTNKILVELGDRLWKEANAVVAAHVCYLLAGNTVEAPSPSSKIALLGADHRSPDEARFYVSPSAVQRTEIYEWVQKRINPAATNMIPFQGYKLIYAMILADHGKLETAFKYVNSMLTVIRAITATMKPGTSMYLEGMQNQLVVLDDRLRQHLGQDRADSVAAAASAKQGKQWGLGSALSIMGKIVNRVVEGNDGPQQAALPRSANGSLFPGAPRSNNNNLNAAPEYPSGAAVGYSSQSGPTMVPAAPGSGRSGGIYASHPGPYNHSSTQQTTVAPTPAHAPSVPAAFNVPRQLSGRNSAPPHQPTPDYPAPKSGSGGQPYPAPLSGGNSFNAPPPAVTQPPPSFPQESYNQPPVAEAPPPFQKPTLDLSGSAGKKGFGNEPAQAEASKPKSPPRSPRARGDGAPGSDKGSASPKAKEAPKKGGRSKTPPPSRSSSGWFSGISTGISTFIAGKMNPDAKVAKLGEHMDAYFDEEKKRWVFPGETQTDEPVIPSAPPTGPLPGSTPGSSSGGPPGSGPPGAHSAPGSMAGGAAANDPLAALMAPPPARSLMKKDPLAAMMAPPPRAAFGPRSSTMPAKRPPPRPQFAVFKPAPSSQASSAPSDQGPPSSSGEPPALPQ